MEICFIESKIILSLSYEEENHCKKYILFSLWNRTGNSGVFLFWLQSNERIILIGGNKLTEREVISHYFHCSYD